MLAKLMVFAAALLLAACQPQAKQTARPSKPVLAADSALDDLQKQGAASVKTNFKPELLEIQKEITSRLVSACYAYAGQEQAMDACFRERMLVAFDDSGAARKYCSTYIKFEDFFECVLDGNVASTAMQRLNAKVMPTEHDWRDVKHNMPRLMAVALVESTTGCLEANAGEMSSCQESEATKMLKIPEELVERCKSIETNLGRGMCIGNAFGVDYVRQRMTKI